jgi:hypothetical protein
LSDLISKTGTGYYDGTTSVVTEVGVVVASVVVRIDVEMLYTVEVRISRKEEQNDEAFASSFRRTIIASTAWH